METAMLMDYSQHLLHRLQPAVSQCPGEAEMRTSTGPATVPSFPTICICHNHYFGVKICYFILRGVLISKKLLRLNRFFEIEQDGDIGL